MWAASLVSVPSVSAQTPGGGWPEPGDISTVLGAGAGGVSLSGPITVAVGLNGDLFVSDVNHYRILRLDSGGTVTQVVGTGTAGFSGDGGPAASAQINRPRGLVVSPAGDLYVADSNNHRIRRVDYGTGVIETVAGTGVSGYSGDGGPAADAQLNTPEGLAWGPGGDLFIADSANDVVRRIGADGVISTVPAPVLFGGGVPGLV